MSQKTTEAVQTTMCANADIRIVSQHNELFEMIKSDPAFSSLCETLGNVRFANRVTPQERTEFCAGQCFIVIDFLDTDPGNAPWESYERFETEAREKGASASIFPVWGNTEKVLRNIQDAIMSILHGFATPTIAEQ